MKKLLLYITMFFLVGQICGQTNTYPFPSSGNLGIGTTSPVGILHIHNNVSYAHSTNHQLVLSNGGYRSSESGTLTPDNAGIAYYFTAYNAGGKVYDRTLDIRVRGASDGTYGAGMIRFFANNYTNGSAEREIMRIHGNGNVGIGTINPTYTLDVNGTGSINGNLNVASTLAYGRAIIATAETKTNATWTSASTALFLSTNETDQPFGIKFGILGSTSAANRYVSLQTGEHDVANTGNLALQHAGGNVGIGTTSPLNLLHVSKSNGTAYSSTAQMRISSGGSGGSRATILLSDDALSDGKISYLPASVSENRLLSLSASSVESDFVIRGNGNIGIGTTSPVAKLSISNGGAGGLEIDPVSGTNGGTDILSYNRSTSAYKQLTAKAYNFAFGTSTTNNALVILNGGNIGIGIASPSEKLSVNGNISAKKIIVTQLGWSDYVFNDDYKLRSLSSVESFIRQNKHLPEVPSAKEVEDKGISVGDNQALLLKKIEELTLYMIEMNKRNDQMEKEIRQLKLQKKEQ
jgi:hypothetical protein